MAAARVYLDLLPPKQGIGLLKSSETQAISVGFREFDHSLDLLYLAHSHLYCATTVSKTFNSSRLCQNPFGLRATGW
jgi:hypothetical protein